MTSSIHHPDNLTATVEYRTSAGTRLEAKIGRCELLSLMEDTYSGDSTFKVVTVGEFQFFSRWEPPRRDAHCLVGTGQRHNRQHGPCFLPKAIRPRLHPQDRNICRVTCGNENQLECLSIVFPEFTHVA